MFGLTNPSDNINFVMRQLANELNATISGTCSAFGLARPQSSQEILPSLIKKDIFNHTFLNILNTARRRLMIYLTVSGVQGLSITYQTHGKSFEILRWWGERVSKAKVLV